MRNRILLLILLFLVFFIVTVYAETTIKAEINKTKITAGKITTKLGYEFILIPLKPGKITIGAAEIKIKDQVYKSESFNIEVTPGKNKPKIPSQNKPQLPRNIPLGLDESKVTL